MRALLQVREGGTASNTLKLLGCSFLSGSLRICVGRDKKTEEEEFREEGYTYH